MKQNRGRLCWLPQVRRAEMADGRQTLILAASLRATQRAKYPVVHLTGCTSPLPPTVKRTALAPYRAFNEVIVAAKGSVHPYDDEVRGRSLGVSNRLWSSRGIHNFSYD
jgi:hypothetical protein